MFFWGLGRRRVLLRCSIVWRLGAGSQLSIASIRCSGRKPLKYLKQNIASAWRNFLRIEISWRPARASRMSWSWLISEEEQGVIYPVSHRSLRIKFWALRTNCETQSKKVRIKKIICEAVQSMHRTTLGADEAKMYNCLIFRGRVGPNARPTASMQWMHAKIDTRLECLLTSTSFRSHKRAQAQTKQEKERKRKVSLFIYWAYVEKACSERPR